MDIKTINAKNYTWIDIQGPNQADIPQIANEYGLGKFLLQDSLEPGHLPKLEKREGYVFFILRAYTAAREVNATNIPELSNKISFFVFSDRLITIHEAPLDFLLSSNKSFDTVHSHLLSLFDKIIDTFDMPAEWHSEDLDTMEEVIFLKNYNQISLEELYFQKVEIRLSKKLLLLNQNVLNKLEFPEQYHYQLTDIKDSVVQYMLEFDEAIDDANNITHTYLSIAAQKSNDVMKLLTIFSAFFLPLTFIVGVYGMNFKWMPELEYKNAYPITMVIMAAICIGIFVWFKRKRIL
jgi:magnesium transporter